jgi:hypothetical protein
MSKPRILVQIDGDAQASVFDGVVAVDAGVDHLFRHGGVKPDQVRELVYGAIFTRGPQDLQHTAIYVGGSDVGVGEELLRRVTESFFGPMRVSVMLDANGANTTAAAAVLAAGRHVALRESTVVVLAATGPVGQRVVKLLAAEGAAVRAASRRRARAEAICDSIRQHHPRASLTALQTASPTETQAALDGAHVVIAAGALGVQLVSASQIQQCRDLKVAIDLNAVPPLGIEGLEAGDKGTNRQGVTGYGAIGVGGTKMKIHTAAIQRLFTTNDLVLDAAEIYAIGRELQDS